MLFESLFSYLNRIVQDIIFRLLQEGFREELARIEDMSGVFESIASVALEEYPHRDLARHLLLYVPDMSKRVIVNELLSEIRQVNHRLLPEREHTP